MVSEVGSEPTPTFVLQILTIPEQPPLKFDADNVVSQNEGKLRVHFRRYTDVFIYLLLITIEHNEAILNTKKL